MTGPRRMHRSPSRQVHDRPMLVRHAERETHVPTGAVQNAVSLLGTPLLSHPSAGLLRQDVVLQLQRCHGNLHVQRWIRASTGHTNSGERAAGPPLAPSPTAFASALMRQVEDDGKTGEGPIEGVPVKEEGEAAAPDLSVVNEDGEFDGAVTSNVLPHVFTNKGKTGSGIIHWVGGNGGLGNESVGSIDLVAPVYEHLDPSGKATQGKAWIRPGTGKAKVKRSFRGAPAGPNGPTAYMTSRASRRVDVHERLHIAASKSHHDTNVKPLEKRVAKHRGKASAMKSGSTGADAETALKTFVNWNVAVAAFVAADTTDNTPGGTVDTNDLASGTYIVDYGPRKVKKVNYAHYYDTPPGPKP